MKFNTDSLKQIFGTIFIISLTICAAPSIQNWQTIRLDDTLEVLLNQQVAGKLYNSLSVKDGTVLVVKELITEMADQTGKMELTVSVVEKRRYSFNGNLISAYQEMVSPAGKNYWKLEKTGETWIHSSTIGGVENKKKITRVSESLLPTYEMYHMLLDSSLQQGKIWHDSTFELISGSYVHVKVTCRETPSVKNGLKWVFICRNSMTEKDEVWELDKKGKTIFQDIYPFVAKAGTTKSSSGAGANLFEAFSISVPPLNSKQQICLQLDSSVHIDSSVLWLYTQDGNCFLLNDIKAGCSSAGITRLADLMQYTKATPTMQIENPEIINLAKKIAGKKSADCSFIKIFNDYVYSSLRKQNTATFSSALETLRAGFGDCGEHAVLLAALLRASGVPARVVLGLVYMNSKGGYFYHAWVMAYVGEWVFADPSHGVFPAVSERVPLLIDDAGDRILELSKHIGRVKVEHRNR
jgi:hypothetical protein